MASLYHKVFCAIQDAIFSGSWAEGSVMPTENDLCRLYSVSRITVRRALDELSRIGLVERVQGRGTYVRQSRIHSGDTDKGLLQTMRERGSAVSSRLLSSSLQAVGSPIARALQIESVEGTPCFAWQFRRLRLVDGSPLAIMESYVQKSLGEAMLSFDLETASFYELYARILGSPVVRTEGLVSAVIPDAADCSLLGVPEGSAHLRYRSIGSLEDGRVAEICYSIFNASRYEFAVAGFRPRNDSP